MVVSIKLMLLEFTIPIPTIHLSRQSAIAKWLGTVIAI